MLNLIMDDWSHIEKIQAPRRVDFHTLTCSVQRVNLWASILHLTKGFILLVKTK